MINILQMVTSLHIGKFCYQQEIKKSIKMRKNQLRKKKREYCYQHVHRYYRGPEILHTRACNRQCDLGIYDSLRQWTKSEIKNVVIRLFLHFRISHCYKQQQCSGCSIFKCFFTRSSQEAKRLSLFANAKWIKAFVSEVNNRSLLKYRTSPVSFSHLQVPHLTLITDYEK